MTNILEQGITATVAGLDEESRASLVFKMEQYIKELILFNSAYNLTNTSDHDELVIRHILDSLSGYEIIKQLAQKAAEQGAQAFTIGDIGSGGGLPGIPLAAAFLCTTDLKVPVRFTLVERMEKRCSFLENCCALLGLSNASVMNCQAEKVPSQSFDVSVFRAFRPLDEQMTTTLLNLTKQNGVLCAYKAKLANIKEEMEGIKKLVPEYEVLPLKVPGLEDSERNIVLVRK